MQFRTIQLKSPAFRVLVKRGDLYETPSAGTGSHAEPLADYAKDVRSGFCGSYFWCAGGREIHDFASHFTARHGFEAG